MVCMDTSNKEVVFPNKVDPIEVAIPIPKVADPLQTPTLSPSKEEILSLGNSLATLIEVVFPNNMLCKAHPLHSYHRMCRPSRMRE